MHIVAPAALRRHGREPDGGMYRGGSGSDWLLMFGGSHVHLFCRSSYKTLGKPIVGESDWDDPD